MFEEHLLKIDTKELYPVTTTKLIPNTKGRFWNILDELEPWKIMSDCRFFKNFVDKRRQIK